MSVQAIPATCHGSTIPTSNLHIFEISLCYKLKCYLLQKASLISPVRLVPSFLLSAAFINHLALSFRYLSYLYLTMNVLNIITSNSFLDYFFFFNHWVNHNIYSTKQCSKWPLWIQALPSRLESQWKIISSLLLYIIAIGRATVASIWIT